MEDHLPRKLAAVLYADVAGYSRLTGEDEDATHRTLSEYLDLVTATIERHRGVTIHYAGDAVLAKFDAVVDAVSAAVAIQTELRTRNQTIPNERKLVFRIGVNLGDVIEDRGDIYGHGVNVAARLANLAEVGGICISDAVRVAIGKRLPLIYEHMGKQKVKNIAEPVLAYKVLEPGDTPTSTEEVTLESGEKPSIAVLPFENLSDDVDQEYFADGIAEEVITALSRFHWFFVISRQSSFVYRQKSVDTKQIANELSVRYILTGSVRRSGNRIRIAVQLVEGTTGHQVWSDRYDRQIDDVFVVQDEIAQCIIASVAPESLTAEIRRARQKREYDLDAWEMVMRAHWHLLRFTSQDSSTAKQLLLTASKSDPSLSIVFSDLAFIYVYEGLFGWAQSFETSVREAEHAAQQAVELDSRDAWAQVAIAFVDHIRGRHEIALRRYQRAVALNPNLAYAYGHPVMTLGFLGEQDAAERYFQTAIRLSPHDPAKVFWLNGVAMAAYVKGDYNSAAQWAEQMVEENPNYPGGLRILAASYGQLGRLEEARTTALRLLDQVPTVTISSTANQLPFKNDSDCARYSQGLRKAGLPE